MSNHNNNTIITNSIQTNNEYCRTNSDDINKLTTDKSSFREVNLELHARDYFVNIYTNYFTSTFKR